jgi:lysozyme
MNQKSNIIELLRQEEGVRYSPYLDSLGYPTIGVGFKLGPQGASLRDYTFTLSNNTINTWLDELVTAVYARMMQNSEINFALGHCNSARQDILISMAYQMGVAGLGGFHQMLSAIIAEEWETAASQMMSSCWAKQTPSRAQRHRDVMLSGQWRPVYTF